MELFTLGSRRPLIPTFSPDWEKEHASRSSDTSRVSTEHVEC